MQEIWSEMKKQWIKFGEDFSPELNKGATENDIKLLEDKLKISLPKEFIDFYKVHNGQADNGSFIFENMRLLSIKEIIDTWEIIEEAYDDDYEEADVDEEIQKSLWNNKWIPFTENGGGDHLCIDMIPSQKGNKGQIITFWHDWNKRSIEGSSLTDYLKKYISKIENGILIYDDEYGVSERI